MYIIIHCTYIIYKLMHKAIYFSKFFLNLIKFNELNKINQFLFIF